MHCKEIDIHALERKEYFEHYMHHVPCTYSMTVDIDVTHLIENHTKLYPAMIFALSSAVNQIPNFRYQYKEGKLYLYDRVHPSYTIFSKENEHFSSIYTPFEQDFDAFLAHYQEDVAKYGACTSFCPQQNMPENTFPVSMIPWQTFSSFHLDLQYGYDFLPPIFTIGKYQKREGKTLLPLSIQVHHAVCDGFHVCALVDLVQQTVQSI